MRAAPALDACDACVNITYIYTGTYDQVAGGISSRQLEYHEP